jgi:acyl-CoA dehydrogenase
LSGNLSGTMRDIFESTIERLLADLSTPEAVRASEGGAWPAALWSAVEDSGFALAAAPESAGGAGASWDDLYPVLAACGRHNLPVPLPEAMLANWLLGRAGLEAQSGPLSFAVGSTLTLANGRVSGRLSGVPWGRHVEHVVAITQGAQPTLVVLAPSAATQQTQRLNLAGEPRDDLDFDAAAPVASATLPSDLADDVLLQGGAMLRGAQAAGALQALLDMCTQHATERVQFGKPIGSFQAIGHQIAVMAEHVALASVSAEAACAESGDDGLALLPIAAAKVCSAEASSISAGIAHAVHGAIGFTHEFHLHLTTRRLWAWRSEYGSLTDWSQRIGRAACAGGASGFWAGVTSGTLPALTASGATR